MSAEKVIDNYKLLQKKESNLKKEQNMMIMIYIKKRKGKFVE